MLKLRRYFVSLIIYVKSLLDWFSVLRFFWCFHPWILLDFKWINLLQIFLVYLFAEMKRYIHFGLNIHTMLCDLFCDICEDYRDQYDQENLLYNSLVCLLVYSLVCLAIMVILFNVLLIMNFLILVSNFFWIMGRKQSFAFFLRVFMFNLG